jgi:leader peptidase (prepilin peptidase)/N-methyltransferase
MLTVLGAGALLWKFGVTWNAVSTFFFFCLLMVASFIDFDLRIIPDSISLGGLVAGLVLSAVGTHISLWASIGGATLGFGFLFSIATLYLLATGREGLGGGDIKLIAMIGSFLGPQGVFLTILSASILGVAVGGLTILLAKKNLRMQIPFGPFLSIGALLTLFFAEKFMIFQ